VRRKKGYGGQKFPLQHNQAKVSKKHSLMLKCGECNYILQRKGIRLKKAEVV
jgi:large subunit ribosomal protein L44e